MKFSQIERGINNFSAASRGDQKFNRVFHPVSTTPSREDNSLNEQGALVVRAISVFQCPSLPG